MLFWLVHLVGLVFRQGNTRHARLCERKKPDVYRLLLHIHEPALNRLVFAESIICCSSWYRRSCTASTAMSRCLDPNHCILCCPCVSLLYGSLSGQKGGREKISQVWAHVEPAQNTTRMYNEHLSSIRPKIILTMSPPPGSG